MGTGYLTVEIRTNFETLPVAGARVKIMNIKREPIYELITDENGKTELVPLDTPDREYSLNPDYANYTEAPYLSYIVEAEAKGYEIMTVNGVHIFDNETSIQPVIMIPMLKSEKKPSHFILNIGKHSVEMTEEREQPGMFNLNMQPIQYAQFSKYRERTLQGEIHEHHRATNAAIATIPDIITVHLGRPGSNAQNVRVPFIDYIKKAASHEIYPTWHDNSLKANIYAIITFALNRIHTKWYRSRGYVFDITNSTAFDQSYVHSGTVYASVNRIVDEIFNQYVCRANQTAPFFTSYSNYGNYYNGNGITSKYTGYAVLSQWGTLTLANQGRSPLQILRYYYPNDIEIAESTIFSESAESYPGSLLKTGGRGKEVQVMQKYLNRIRQNYPAIPLIPSENGVFGESSEAAVRAFQRAFNLAPDGIIGKATWYRIFHIYADVTKLAELGREANTLGIGEIPPNVVLKQGSTGNEVASLQYILKYISKFHSVISAPIQDGKFGAVTARSVSEFQHIMGLARDGTAGPLTWNALYDMYWGIINNT